MNWMRVWAVARRHAYVLQRKPQRWFDLLVWPVVDAVLFGSLGLFFARQSGLGPRAIGILVGGIVLFHVVFQAEVSLATGLLEETWSRNLLNLMVTPLKEVEYAAGVALFGLFKLVLSITTVSLVAFGLFAFRVTDLGLPLVPIVRLLLVVRWAIGLLVVGLVLHFGDGAEILAWGLLAMLMPLSGVFFPPEALPTVLRPLGRLMPTTHVFDAARAVLDGGSVPWGDLATAAIGSLLLAAACLLFLTRMLATFRRRGYISRYM